MVRLCLILVFLFSSVCVFADCGQRVYFATENGIVPNEESVQTNSIQCLIDRVSLKGGGRIVFSSGIYVTGSIELKSNVHLYLERGASILGSTNPFDYTNHVFKNEPESPNGKDVSTFALIIADGVNNISLSGHGTIDGRGRELALAVDSLHHSGAVIDKNYNTYNKRPGEAARPLLFRFFQVDGVNIKDLSLRNSACWGVTVELSNNVVIDNVNIHNRAYWNNDGLDITDCRNVRISNCNIDTADDGICLKSYYTGYCNDSIYIYDCRVSSSASAVKFGTASFGGFKNVVIDNIDIYDTFRSAIAIESVDGGFIRNVYVTRINAKNTGNAIFMRLGHRKGKTPGVLEDIYIGDIKVEIPFGRPDINYDLRGPEEPFFHNPFPSSIVGIPDNKIRNVVIENIDILYPGRASKGMAYVPLWRLNSVPEEVTSYPEFSMFGELPSWGFYVRHAENIIFRDVRLRLADYDFRPAFVFDDVCNVSFINLSIPYEENQIVVTNSSNIEVESNYNLLNY